MNRMKSFLCLLLAAVTLAGASAVPAGADDITVYASACDTDVGDANGDGKVNISDVSVMLKYIAKWDGLKINPDKADVVNDDKIILSDVSLLLKHVAKWKSIRLGHNDSRTVVVKATCKSSGESLLTCKVCGSTQTVYPDPVPCDYRTGYVCEPTCVFDGARDIYCTMCGDYRCERIPATGIHDNQEWYRVEPTCGTDGAIVYQCKTCYTPSSTPIKATGKHNYVCGKCTLCGGLQSGTTEKDVIKNAQLEVLRLVNVERKKAGLKELSYYNVGQVAGDTRANELTKSFSHTRPDGRDCFSVFTDYGIHAYSMGENIALGHTTPQEVVTGWMNSPGHRANILNPDFTHLIVGVKGDVSGTGAVWVQLFLGL